MSADDGATWLDGNTDVPQTQASVLVRARISWTPGPPSEFFASIAFDATISNAGATDTIDQIRLLNLGQLAFLSAIVPTRFGNTIKIDHQSDVSPPGTGSRWIVPSNGNIVQFPADFANPITVFMYEIALDGTPGMRSIGSVFPNAFVLIGTDEIGGRINLPRTAFAASVTVLPAPGAVALLALGGVVAARRRR